MDFGHSKNSRVIQSTYISLETYLEINQSYSTYGNNKMNYEQPQDHDSHNIVLALLLYFYDNVPELDYDSFLQTLDHLSSFDNALCLSHAYSCTMTKFVGFVLH
jgi:hypothetical protein